MFSSFEEKELGLLKKFGLVREFALLLHIKMKFRKLSQFKTIIFCCGGREPSFNVGRKMTDI